MLISVIILYPVLYYAVWQIHFAHVLYIWDKKGSIVEKAIKVENLGKEIDWDEQRDVDQVSQQKAAISAANDLISQFEEHEMNEEFES